MGRFFLLRSALILIFALAVTWLSLSGYFTPMLLTLGGISIALVVFMSARMRIIDKETAPYMSVPKSLSYFSWLFVEIIKANIAVVKAVLSPNMEISPVMTKIKIRHRAPIARTMFANSITLTPGTVSVDMTPDHILVHALLTEMSAPEDFDEMGQRSAWSVSEFGPKDA